MVLQIIMNSLVTGSIYSLIAFGFTLIYGSMNFFNMAYGTNVMLGAYAFYISYRILSLPLLASAVFACAVTALLMLGIDRVCYFGFRQKRVPSWAIVVIAMSVATLVHAVITMAFGSSSRAVYFGIPKSVSLLGTTVTTIQLGMFAAAIVIVVAFTLLLKYTRTGKLIRALSNDKVMATVVGIDVERVYIVIIAAGSILATIAGIFYALDSNVRPHMSNLLLTKAIVATIVGGVGNIKRAMFAGFLIGFVENFSVIVVGSGWRDAIPLFIIIIAMLLRPSAFGIEEAR